MEYRVETPLFEGPLDLLLHLIEKEELDITRLALAQVTDQFLARVEAMRDAPDMEMVADFLVVAAKLLLIKSKALLPRPPQSETVVDGEDEIGDELIQQLRTYRRYKEAAQWLRERDGADLHAYVRLAPPPRPQKVTLDLSDVSLEALHAIALNAIYPSAGARPEEAIQRPRISIVQQIQRIRERLTQWKRVAFQAILGHRPTRLEAVVTLQAVLELVKQQTIRATQGSRFGEIFIESLVPPEQIREAPEAEPDLS